MTRTKLAVLARLSLVALVAAGMLTSQKLNDASAQFGGYDQYQRRNERPQLGKEVPPTFESIPTRFMLKGQFISPISPTSTSRIDTIDSTELAEVAIKFSLPEGVDPLKVFALTPNSTRLLRGYVIPNEESTVYSALPATVSVLPATTVVEGDVASITDGDPESAVTFKAVPRQRKIAFIVFQFAKPVTLAGIEPHFSGLAGVPTHLDVELITSLGGVNVAKRDLFTGETIKFPVRKDVHSVRMTVEYDQDIALADVQFGVVDSSQPNQVGFVVESDSVLTIYAKPDQDVPSLLYTEYDSFVMKDKPFQTVAVELQDNPDFIPVDTDGDGVANITDNCASIFNPDQADRNDNGAGDECDDHDADGVLQIDDNCPDVPNPDQMDDDGDGKGDACDQVESRLTEQLKWLPWVGIGLTLLAMIGLMVKTVRSGSLTELSHSDDTVNGENKVKKQDSDLE